MKDYQSNTELLFLTSPRLNPIPLNLTCLPFSQLNTDAPYFPTLNFHSKTTYRDIVQGYFNVRSPT